MAAQGKTDTGVIRQDIFPFPGLAQHKVGFFLVRRGEQGCARPRVQHLPAGAVTVFADAVQGIGVCQTRQVCLIQPCTRRNILCTDIPAPFSLKRQGVGAGPGQTLDQAQTQAQSSGRSGLPRGALQGTIIIAVVHVNGQDGHAMAPGVLHQLRRPVEPERLAVQQGAGESSRVIILQPG